MAAGGRPISATRPSTNCSSKASTWPSRTRSCSAAGRAQRANARLPGAPGARRSRHRQRQTVTRTHAHITTALMRAIGRVPGPASRCSPCSQALLPGTGGRAWRAELHSGGHSRSDPGYAAARSTWGRGQTVQLAFLTLAADYRASCWIWPAAIKAGRPLNTPSPRLARGPSSNCANRAIHQ